MELRARIRPLPRRAAMMAACVALLVTALAAAIAPSAADAKKKRKAPVVTKVTPMDVAVGEKLTIRGRNFIKGRMKNTVVFKRAGARAVFAKADLSTKKLMSITIPASLEEFFVVKQGVAVPTRFRLRLLSRTLGKKFTGTKRSPVVRGPRMAPPPSAASGDCDGDGVLNNATNDDDGDLLSDMEETRILSDPCKADTDGDGVEDGFEYQSAIDLNDDEYQAPNQILAYPHKMPYPNPGFADAGVDYDGDSLTLREEQMLWKYTYTVNKTATRTLTPLSYSDGMQFTLSTRTGPNGRRAPSQRADTYPPIKQFEDWARATGYLTIDLRGTFGYPHYTGVVGGTYDIRDVDLDGDPTASEKDILDIDHDGDISDEERDEDADGLSNYDELYGRMVAGYWNACYAIEVPYPVKYSGTKVDDADTDGDGILDGADDQDHDDLPNIMELSRHNASHENDLGAKSCTPRENLLTDDLDASGKPDIEEYGRHPNVYGRVNPFNPCLPFIDSRTCSHYAQFGAWHAPFDASPNWLALQ